MNEETKKIFTSLENRLYFLTHHNKNYTKKQYFELCDLEVEIKKLEELLNKSKRLGKN